MTKRADYALLALSHLAAASSDDPNRLMNTKEIAEQYEIPVELLAKILQILAKHGMVASHPGPTGGYKLLRPARDISVAEVVTIVDGPFSLLHCTAGEESSCKQYSRCTIRDPLATIEQRVKDLLAEISIEEISLPAPDPKFEDFSARPFAAGITLIS
ncbi:MAG: Rrf2 family transcriptional regulator [Capsulimonas sp.]|jgi:Rrf2 family protein|uniref:RrF2 family transcriptional regulator n=1 Tax=Capsulimonas sp. TaxID=2494211 RepID=UPI003267EB7E